MAKSTNNLNIERESKELHNIGEIPNTCRSLAISTLYGAVAHRAIRVRILACGPSPIPAPLSFTHFASCPLNEIFFFAFYLYLLSLERDPVVYAQCNKVSC